MAELKGATPEHPPLDVEKLRRLEAGASPGPWIAEHDEGVDAWDIWLGPERGGVVANIISNISDGPGFGDRGKANAELIAALRNQLPAILAALGELEGLRSDVRTLWDREVISYFTAGDRERECGSVMGTLKWIDESEIPALGAILRTRHAEYVAARVAAREAEEESGG